MKLCDICSEPLINRHGNSKTCSPKCSAALTARRLRYDQLAHIERNREYGRKYKRDVRFMITVEKTKIIVERYLMRNVS